MRPAGCLAPSPSLTDTDWLRSRARARELCAEPAAAAATARRGAGRPCVCCGRARSADARAGLTADGAVVWLTGRRGAGKSTIAVLLEERLLHTAVLYALPAPPSLLPCFFSAFCRWIRLLLRAPYPPLSSSSSSTFFCFFFSFFRLWRVVCPARSAWTRLAWATVSVQTSAPLA